MKLGNVRLVTVLGVCCLSLTGVLQAAEQGGATTLDNLQAAYSGESNARARYEAFAAKADKEGYTTVAHLFRAAAAAEAIHASQHAAVIAAMGAEPKAKLDVLDVKSTRDNVETALKGETWEKESMYPAFIKQAQAEQDTAAVTTFERALAAEVQHAKYYQQALSNLEGWKNGGSMFAVCPVCGFTTMDEPPLKCPVCSTAGQKFRQFPPRR